MTQPTSAPLTYDAVVIGAGAGGMCTAARLVANGKKVLLTERLDRLGGRASSETIDGHVVNIGAIAIERGGVFEETFEMLGVPLDIREPNPATVFYIDGKVINVAKGGWGMLLGTFTKQAAKIGAKFADARAGDLPEARMSTQEWLSQYTSNETVHAIFRNLCAAIFAANADELPARAFLTYFAIKGAFKRFGFCPRGTVGLWNDLGDGIRARGGEIWLGAPVTALHADKAARHGAGHRVPGDRPPRRGRRGDQQHRPGRHRGAVRGASLRRRVRRARPQHAQARRQHRHQLRHARAPARRAGPGDLRQDAPPVQHGRADRHLPRAGAGRLVPVRRVRGAQARRSATSTRRPRSRSRCRTCARCSPGSRTPRCCRSA